MRDFLFEIHTEELPPKALHKLAQTLLKEMETRLRKAELSFASSRYFATPRRLAILVSDLIEQQADTIIDRKGPAIAAAFDQEGKPTPASEGFARSCGVSVDQLIRIDDKWLGYKQAVRGKSVFELLPDMVRQALLALPIPKRMRWGESDVEFVRPVHSVVMLYGKDIIPAEILGCQAGRVTDGHRFMSSGPLEIAQASDYAAMLEKAYVIADFTHRKKIIRDQVLTLSPQVDIDDDLLEEITALVEWPVALRGNFDTAFLKVPQEALISAMKDHQRYFSLIDTHGKLLPHFIVVSNIQSQHPERVVAGNERVLRARLSDAAFFFETDQKKPLVDRVDDLKTIIFQAKLGTLYDKTEHIKQLSQWIAHRLDANIMLAERASLLAKTDLTTSLVGEFPELQGIAGCYYAIHDGESVEVALALKEQYLPRFSGDAVPTSLLGSIVAIADRVDTLVGIFSIGLLPTGDKDPYGLRRAALGVLRILIENKLCIDVKQLLQKRDAALAEEVWQFMLERLKPWYQEQSISSDVFEAVAALKITDLYDFHRRIQAVCAFKKMAEAESLSSANKRVSNILAKYDRPVTGDVEPSLFENDAEQALYQRLQHIRPASEYQETLTQLAALRQPVDDFFDHVMVMTDDIPRRENRLRLLMQLRKLFLQVADIALLQ